MFITLFQLYLSASKANVQQNVLVALFTPLWSRIDWCYYRIHLFYCWPVVLVMSRPK